jgi:DNA-binding transcriptional LysR family regulator
MQRRYQGINIPIEVVRTVVEIAEQGSYTKAGERLLLGQPAISAQIKRLQTLVGGPIFEKTATGLRPTSKGKLVIAQARRILESNNRILELGGAVRETPPLRVGLSNLYAGPFCEIWQRRHGDFAEPVCVHCDESSELVRMLSEGYLDVACLVQAPANVAIATWEEPFVWARAPHFVLSPGAPVPLVSIALDLSNSVAVDALERSGVTFRLVFESPDFWARIAAVRAGMGIMALPARHLPADLVVARDYYLPAINSPLGGICVRAGAKDANLDALIQLLYELKNEAPVAQRAG